MSVRSAQIYLVSFALLSVLVCVVVFVTGRMWGLPFNYRTEEHIPLIEMLVPPFVAMVASTANYLADPGETRIPARLKTLFMIAVIGPSLVFLVLFAITTVTFYFSNQPNGSYFSLGEYRTWITILLAMLSGSTVAISSLVFQRGSKTPDNEQA